MMIKILANLRTALLIIIGLVAISSLSGFISSSPLNNDATGVFTYMVNDKVFTLEHMTATLRTTTGGKKQLSLSNDRFVKFFFIEPKVKDFNLAGQTTKE